MDDPVVKAQLTSRLKEILDTLAARRAARVVWGEGPALPPHQVRSGDARPLEGWRWVTLTHNVDQAFLAEDWPRLRRALRLLARHCGVEPVEEAR